MTVFAPKKILVPVDFSPYSRAALREAADIARVHNSRLVLFHVMEDPLMAAALAGGAPAAPPQISGEWLKLKEDVRRDAEGAMGELEREAPGEVEVRHDLTWGSPYREILAKAEAEEFDLIVMSARGREGLGRLLLGGVAERVVRSAPCRTLIIPAEEENEA